SRPGVTRPPRAPCRSSPGSSSARTPTTSGTPSRRSRTSSREGSEVLPYGRQSIESDDIAAVEAALRSDWLTTGPEVDRLEAAIAEGAGVEHAVSATSGTAARHVAYAAAGIEPGDEVVTTPLTFVATAAGAALHGAKIVFADVDPATGNLDPAAVEAAVTERTKVIAGVDYAGVPVDGTALREIASRQGALFLEDAAHSIGSTQDGAPVG